MQSAFLFDALALFFSLKRDLLRTGSVCRNLIWLKNEGYFVGRNDELAKILGICICTLGKESVA